jgi:DNA-directed RNA polymerase subunit M/transcription elongation factor TFIIS
MSSIKFCKDCGYYLVLRIGQPNAEGHSDLFRVCNTCGYQEQEEKGGLITEIKLQEKVAEGYKILMNEFTHLDPTLPHVHNIKCPNEECLTNNGQAKPDVIYMKYDLVNLKFLYICTVCKQNWKSRT